MIEGNEQELHSLRQQIDACIKEVESILGPSAPFKAATYQRELSLVRTKLQEAKMWAGKCLEQLGAEFPAELRDEAKTE